MAKKYSAGFIGYIDQNKESWVVWSLGKSKTALGVCGTTRENTNWEGSKTSTLSIIRLFYV